MKKICIELENCYGIPKFRDEFEFSEDKKAHLIYAPNGVMKTSFATTVSDICMDRETKDVFYPDRVTKRLLKYDSFEGEDLPKQDILVINSYEESYKSINQNVLVADTELKEEYELLHNEIDKKMGMLFKNINKLSGKNNSENIIASDFDVNVKDIYEKIESLYDEFQAKDKYTYTEVKYGKVVTTDSIKVLQNSDVQQKLREYIDQYELLLTSSKVFKSTFNHNNAENVLKTLGTDGYFKANHKILLYDTEVPIGEDVFKETIDNEKKRILDEELSTEFNNIDKLLSAKKANKDLRDFIVKNKHLISELLDINTFKKKLWISYLFENETIVNEAVSNYKNNKMRLQEIIKTANEQLYKWNDVVLGFNNRFSNMPFTVDIENKDDVILKDKAPMFKFLYKNRGSEISVSEDMLKERLSNGEKKALYLLNVIFEFEAKKEIGNQCFIVMDDIADSFDYRNKYAIIEYIKEIVEVDEFLPIILTHNFDFYRTVAGRIGIKGTSNFVNKTDSEISLCHGQYFANVFDTWRNQVYKNNWIFISSIAFVRNLTEYIVGKENIIYKNLTSLLHYKKNEVEGVMKTDDIKVSDLMDWYKTIWGRDITRFEQNSESSVASMIIDLANKIISEDLSEIGIEYKILLSIAIRQKSERYMVSRINDDSLVNSIKKDQTRKLAELSNFSDNDVDKKINKIIQRVLIITSENIHINSFMYEPIVDMSLEELKNLYRDVITELV